MPQNDLSLFFAVLLLLSGFSSILISGIIWRRRAAVGAIPLLIFLLGIVCWSLFYAFYWLAQAPVAKLFWLKMSYVGVVTVPAALLVFAIRFISGAHWLAGWKAGLLVLEPVITLILLWTDPLHGLFFGDKLEPGLSKIYDGGPWFWINLIYTYALILICILLLIHAARQPNKLSRPQARMVLIGGLIPIFGNLVGFAGLSPFPDLDLTPVLFSLTGACLAYSLLRYRLLDLIPIGRDVLLEVMDEGMLLLDLQRRILDVNPAARKLLELPEDVTGRSMEEALARFPALTRLLSKSKNGSYVLCLRESPPRYISLQMTPVSDRAGSLSGKLVICHDVTVQKIAEQNLRLQLQRIEELQVSLQEQAIHDPLTGLFNRRYLQETLPRELAKAAREKTPLSLVMIDIDNLKEINDMYGHLAGDEILQQLGEILMYQTREGDIVARYGGDEVLVVLSGATLQIAQQRVETWLGSFNRSRFVFEGNSIPVSFSAGIAVYPEHGLSAGELFRRVDAALYQAKSSGRNNIVLVSD